MPCYPIVLRFSVTLPLLRIVNGCPFGCPHVPTAYSRPSSQLSFVIRCLLSLSRVQMSPCSSGSTGIPNEQSEPLFGWDSWCDKLPWRYPVYPTENIACVPWNVELEFAPHTHFRGARFSTLTTSFAHSDNRERFQQSPSQCTCLASLTSKIARNGQVLPLTVINLSFDDRRSPSEQLSCLVMSTEQCYLVPNS